MRIQRYYMPEEYPTPEEIAGNIDLFNIDRHGETASGPSWYNIIYMEFPLDKTVECDYTMDQGQGSLDNLKNPSPLPDDAVKPILKWIAFNVAEGMHNIVIHKVQDKITITFPPPFGGGVHVRQIPVLGNPNASQQYFIYQDGVVTKTSLALPEECLRSLGEWARNNARYRRAEHYNYSMIPVQHIITDQNFQFPVSYYYATVGNATWDWN